MRRYKATGVKAQCMTTASTATNILAAKGNMMPIRGTTTTIARTAIGSFGAAALVDYMSIIASRMRTDTVCLASASLTQSTIYARYVGHSLSGICVATSYYPLMNVCLSTNSI